MLFVDDIKVEIELLGIDGVTGDDIVEMFPVVYEYLVGSVQRKNAFLNESFKCLDQLLLCHLT